MKIVEVYKEIQDQQMNIVSNIRCALKNVLKQIIHHFKADYYLILIFIKSSTKYIKRKSNLMDTCRYKFTTPNCKRVKTLLILT